MIASITKAFIIINHLELSITLAYEYEDKILREKLLEELLTPCLEIWENVLLLPLIGSVTSDRAKKAMEAVLLAATSKSTKVVIIDITGVPLMDTMVANYLIRTVNSLKLVGVESILTGIGPAIAQTVVSLGVDLTFIPTKRTLSEGLKYAINKLKAQAQQDTI